MTVAELRTFLEQFDESLEVVVGIPDDDEENIHFVEVDDVSQESLGDTESDDEDVFIALWLRE
jgi:hypothetical protein